MSEPIEVAVPRRISSVSQSAVLRHPSPGSNAYSRNISRLERSAEEMSQGGSDIAEEIRKMKRETSTRRASIQSGSHSDLHSATANPHLNPRRVSSHGARSRTSSYATHNPHSIVDLNGHARWGGYSPNAFVTSPVGSVRSRGSWTQVSLNRFASSNQSSRLVMVEPLQEGRPLDSPLAPSSASMYSQDQQMSRQASQSSFSRRYDAIANQIEESLQTVPPTPAHHEEHDEQSSHHFQEHDNADRRNSGDTFREAQIAFKDFDGVHFDPDREEYVEVDHDGHEIRRISAVSSSGTLMDRASMLRTSRNDLRRTYYAPPPTENMVYYPAPVPRMLNLPKRLSQQPPPSVQAQRRSQMLSELSAGARQSAPWIPPMTFSEDGHPIQQRQSVPDTRSHRSGSGSLNEPEHPRGMLNQRMSIGNVHNLPPHLRASMFFEHPSIPHDVEVKSESAVATLDSILAASATAPVSAFTDHPYAGDVRKTVYAPERTHQRRSTATTLGTALDEQDKAKQLRKRRSSSIGRLLRRKSTDPLDDEDRNEGKQFRSGRRGSLLAFMESGGMQRRRSQLSLGDELEDKEDTQRLAADQPSERERRRQTGLKLGLDDPAVATSPRDDDDAANRSRPAIAERRRLSDGDQIEADFKEQEEQEYNDIDDDPVFAQPSTLLAELQVRKAQLKSRNRTAATAYPGGMHSTLLQLDAVEQIHAKKRQKQRIQLAWEDPQIRAEEDALRDEMDEDVPLGVLYPAKNGLINQKLGDSRDWDRPMGLMERREMEDNEPLNSRRARLNPNVRIVRNDVSRTQLPEMPAEPDNDEDEGETLGQRLRRLKTKDALDEAISDVAPKNGERPLSTFAASVLDEFPEINAEENKATEKRVSVGSQNVLQAAPGAEAEETLGQRRARLQREREATGDAVPDTGAVRSPLKTSNSLSNLLAANPVGERRVAGKNHQAAQGTLLHSAVQEQNKHKQDLLAVNMRSVSSYNVPDKPLVDDGPQANRNVSSGLLATGQSRPANGAYAGHAAAIIDPFQNKNVNISGLLGAAQSRPTNGAFAGGFYNTNMAGGGVGMQTPMMVMQNSNAYFASPTAGLAYGAGFAANNMMGYQMPQQQPMVNPSAYYALHGGASTPMLQTMPSQSMFHPMAGLSAMGQGTYGFSAQQQMGMGIDQASLDPNQRAAIDRWRMGIAQ